MAVTGVRPALPGRAGAPARTRRPRWLIGLTVLVSLFLLVSLPAYLSFDPGQARVPVLTGLGLHYPLLQLHVAAGAVAMVTALFQLWPGFRARHPHAHRLLGRTYAGAILLGAPALAALVVIRGVAGTGSPAVVVGFGFLTVVWVVVTVSGVRAARRGDLVAHRRAMVYSVALTMSIIWSRLAFVVAMAVPGVDVSWVEDNTGWAPWVLNLLLAHWWLGRRRGAATAG